MRRTARNKRALQRIFADQTRPKFLAVVPKVRRLPRVCHVHGHHALVEVTTSVVQARCCSADPLLLCL